MKKTITTIFLTLGIITFSFAQSISAAGSDQRLFGRIQVGSSHPLGEFSSFAKTRFHYGVSVDYIFSDFWGVGLDFGRQNNELEVDYSHYNFPPTSTEYALVTSSTREHWNTTHLGFGPVFRFAFNDGFGPVHYGRMHFEVYSRVGISLVKSASTNTQLVSNGASGDLFNLPEQDLNGLSVTSGFRIHFPFGKGHSFYINPQHVFTNVQVDYEYRDLDIAYSNGRFNPSAAIYEDRMVADKVNPNFFNINLGLSFSLNNSRTGSTRIR